jgi:nonribosomal peptide synthetase DhbF
LARRLANGHTPGSDLETVLPLRLHGSKQPLFCIHHAGGFSWPYARLIPHIPSDRPIYGIQARSLIETDDLPDTLEQVSADYLRLIREIQPDGPYNLLGWSFGGLVAHSIATQLQSIDQKVAMLALLDSYPAGRHRALHDHDDREHEKERLFAGVADDSIRSMLDTLRREGDALPSLKEIHYEAIKNSYKNNVRLMASFLPQRFRGDALLFVAMQGDAKPSHQVWSPYVSGRIEVHRIDCTHEAMMEPMPAAKIGSVLATELDRQPPTPQAQRRTK